MAKTLSDLLTELYDITKRPDLESASITAIKNATLKMHHCEFWERDIVEQSFGFTTLQYIYSLDYSTIAPFFRHMHYLRKLTYNATPVPTAGDFIRPIDPTCALDEWGLTKTNVYYIAGTVIQIRTDAAQQYFTWGYFRHPDVSSANYSSWIANNFSYAIVDEAASRIFKVIGKDDEAAMYKQLMAENMQLLKISNVIVEQT